MAASRYVTSFVKLTQISGTKLTCGNFHRLVTIPQNVVCQPKQISSILLATRLLHYRCYSQKPDETQTTSKPATASPILGSFQGLGIAGEVLKSQDETEGKKSTLSGQQQQNNSSFTRGNNNNTCEAKRDRKRGEILDSKSVEKVFLFFEKQTRRGGFGVGCRKVL